MVAVVLLLAGGTVWTAGVRVEGRESTDPNGSRAPRQAVVQLEPEAGLSTGREEVRASLRYFPRLLAGDLDSAGSSQILHRASAASKWVPERTRSLTLEEQGTFGRQDFSPLPTGAAAPGLDPRLSALRSVPFGSSSPSCATWMRRPRACECAAATAARPSVAARPIVSLSLASGACALWLSGIAAGQPAFQSVGFVVVGYSGDGTL